MACETSPDYSRKKCGLGTRLVLALPSGLGTRLGVTFLYMQPAYIRMLGGLRMEQGSGNEAIHSEHASESRQVL